MTSVCFYFQVHQPFRIRPYQYTEIGHNHFYEDEEKNRAIMNKVADKCYIPANQKMLKLIKIHNGKFKISYSISGVALEQFEKYRPDVLDSFRELIQTGCVELLSETYYHSLSFIYSRDEFKRQVLMHQNKIKKLFGVQPVIFRNTELIYNNDLAHYVGELGYRAVVCEGVDRILNGRSPNHVFTPKASAVPALLLKNYKLSDDIAFRFSNTKWEEYPLTAEKYAEWLHHHAVNSEVINLFMDYETFGEHQWEETGVFNFLDRLPEAVLKHPDFDFCTPSETLNRFEPRAEYDAPSFISWADSERDLSAWMENKMQQHALYKIYDMEELIMTSGRDEFISTWRKLQTSDHYYYMSTKYWSDGDVHKYFSPFDSPYDAHIYFMNILSDLEVTVKSIVKEAPQQAITWQVNQAPPKKRQGKRKPGDNIISPS